MKMDKVLETLKENYALRASLKRKHLKVQDELEEAYNDERVLFISISNNTRVNKATASTRNRYVVDLAQEVFFRYVC